MGKEILKYSVAVAKDAPGIYSYEFNQELEIGQVVLVEFRNKEALGIILDNKPTFEGKLKSILSIIPYKIPSPYIKFLKFVSEYNILKLGAVVKLLLPFSIDALLFPEKTSKKASIELDQVDLNPDQKTAVNEISNYLNQFKTILLHGVTGSGKTEVFLQTAKSLIQSDNSSQILILVPEIALSIDLAKKVSSRLGCEVFIWHNSVSPTTKRKIWKKAIEGEQIVIVGARSALFIPFFNLKLIVIDEEHDNSFKQSEGLIYNARDMAIYLGSCLNIPVILSSATPSIESYSNAQSQKYLYIKLNNKYFAPSSPPVIKLVDLREDNPKSCLSFDAISEIRSCVDNNNQALIFVNRRGHTPKILCKDCGEKVTCPACSTWLCYHAQTNECMCHCCGHRAYPPKVCKACGSQNLIGIGMGIEKVYDECKELFPTARIIVLSSDTINTNKKISEAIEKIQKREVDIILGTQIIAKGHNFGGLSLVVLPFFDSMMYGEDFRSAEKTFQILTQVSGRAGRSSESYSKIIIQTYNPDEYLLKIFRNGNTDEFYKTELQNRTITDMPPIRKMAAINISSLSEADLKTFAQNLVIKAPRRPDLKILGPIQPLIYKIKSRYRLKVVFISSGHIQGYLNRLISSIKVPHSIRLSIDIDPYDFY